MRVDALRAGALPVDALPADALSVDASWADAPRNREGRLDLTGVRVWDGRVAADRAAWVDAWGRMADGDPFSHPGFLEAFAGDGEVPMCAHLRGLDDEALARLFWQAFDAWARAARAVTEFVRLSLDDDVLPSPGSVTPRLINYIAQLPATAQELWDSYAPKVRQNARHAQRAGVTIEIDTTGDRLAEFLAIHELTMERRGSEDRYRVCVETLTGLHEEMPGSFAYVYAMSAGRAVSVDLVLLGARTAYYHLGGTSADAFGLRPNDLVKTAAMEYARSAGRTRFVLGGGLHDGDGLERYKRGFAPRGAQDFCTTERILDPVVHGSLVRDLESRVRAERAAGGFPDWVDGPDFFPAYRRRFTVPAPVAPAGATHEPASADAAAHEHAQAHDRVPSYEHAQDLEKETVR